MWLLARRTAKATCRPPRARSRTSPAPATRSSPRWRWRSPPGATLAEAARLANEAAGIVVGKFGPATVTPRGTAARARSSMLGIAVEASARRSRQCRKVPSAREHHREPVLVGGGDHFRDRAPSRPAARPPSRRPRRPRRGRRGTGRTHPRPRPIRAVTTGPRPRAFITRHLHRVDAAHLAGADRQRPIGRREDHGVRLHVRAHAPREPQRLPTPRRRLPLGHHPQSSDGHGASASTTRSRSCTSTRAENRAHLAASSPRPV